MFRSLLIAILMVILVAASGFAADLFEVATPDRITTERLANLDIDPVLRTNSGIAISRLRNINHSPSESALAAPSDAMQDNLHYFGLHWGSNHGSPLLLTYQTY